MRFFWFRVYVSVCWYVHIWMQMSVKIQREALDNLEVELDVVVSHLTWILGPNLDPLHEQFVFLTAVINIKKINIFLNCLFKIIILCVCYSPISVYVTYACFIPQFQGTGCPRMTTVSIRHTSWWQKANQHSLQEHQVLLMAQ